MVKHDNKEANKRKSRRNRMTETIKKEEKH